MPHIVIEISSNLKDRIDVEGLLDDVHAAALKTGAFAPSAIRTRLIVVDHFRVADGAPDNAFLHAVLRMRPGRSREAKLSIGETIFGAICSRLAPAFESSPLGMTFEIQEIDTEFRLLKDNLADRLRDRKHT